jgi:hypothetical protein
MISLSIHVEAVEAYVYRIRLLRIFQSDHSRGWDKICPTHPHTRGHGPEELALELWCQLRVPQGCTGRHRQVAGQCASTMGRAPCAHGVPNGCSGQMSGHEASPPLAIRQQWLLATSTTALGYRQGLRAPYTSSGRSLLTLPKLSHLSCWEWP